MKKTRVKIEFEQTFKYEIETELTKEDFEIIKDLDNCEVDMILYKSEDRIHENPINNPAYYILEKFIDQSNITDYDSTLNSVTVTKV